jgi:ABC-type sugar transport system permease subunit
MPGIAGGIRRLVFFTQASLVYAAAALYAAGGVQGFTEKAQFFLLNTILYSGLFFAISVFLDFALSGGLALLRDKKSMPLRSFFFLLLGLIAFIFSGTAAAILTLTKGNAV